VANKTGMDRSSEMTESEPAGQCKELAKPEILADKCKGCTACTKKCPVEAITGERKMPHKIDAEKCIKCGECARVCKFAAVIGV